VSLRKLQRPAAAIGGAPDPRLSSLRFEYREEGLYYFRAEDPKCPTSQPVAVLHRRSMALLFGGVVAPELVPVVRGNASWFNAGDVYVVDDGRELRWGEP
jgi:hypothetical protein